MSDPQKFDIVIVGSGSAALCAGLAAREAGASVLVVEKADPSMAGGNSRYTAGAMRFAYDGLEDLLPLLANPDDERIARSDFGSYTESQFGEDLLGFNDGRPLSPEQLALVGESLRAMQWLGNNGVKFEPIYERQSFEKDGRHVFWGGLTLAAAGEGEGLVDAELEAFRSAGGTIRYDAGVTGLLTENDNVCGVVTESSGGERTNIAAGAVVLACGGFEANDELRVEHLGDDWVAAKVRGTPHNTGMGLTLSFDLGAEPYGFYQGCHATPMDAEMPNYGNLEIPHFERKNYRKICYFLGIMVNARGERFVDEGKDFRNYTYAQFGRSVLEQPGHIAWQLFDSKTDDLLYGEYRFHDAHFTEADTIDGLLAQIPDLDTTATKRMIEDYNRAVVDTVPFDPTVKDGRGTKGLKLNKTNWAQTIDTPPFRAYPVTGGITFTYGGLRVDDTGAVLRSDRSPINGLYACGELVGGVFFAGYPGGTGLTSGVVFGRRAGAGAAAAVSGA